MCSWPLLQAPDTVCGVHSAVELTGSGRVPGQWDPWLADPVRHAGGRSSVSPARAARGRRLVAGFGGQHPRPAVHTGTCHAVVLNHRVNSPIAIVAPTTARRTDPGDTRRPWACGPRSALGSGVANFAYETATARGATVVIPPARTANVSGHEPRSPARDRTMTWVKQLGRRRWKNQGTIVRAGWKMRSSDTSPSSEMVCAPGPSRAGE